MIFEDGLQQRDFVSVYDIARACRLALEAPDAAYRVFNVGSGQPRTVLSVAHAMAKVMDRSHVEAQVSGTYRVGDIRHCFADIRTTRRVLGYEPQVAFERGLEELADWLRGQVAVDRVEDMRAELNSRGLAL
jgi:dTDP-L-rhamnose 4-epimerase